MQKSISALFYRNDIIILPLNYSCPHYDTDKSFRKVFPLKMNKNDVNSFNFFNKIFFLIKIAKKIYVQDLKKGKSKKRFTSINLSYTLCK